MEILTHLVLRDGQAWIESKPGLKAEMVARMVVDGSHTIDEVMNHYGIGAADVHSALAYYYDHRQTLDAAYAETLAEIRENAMTLAKFKAQLASKP